MAKTLFFIGHYDYLIYSMLIALSERDASADFIFLNTKNSASVRRFIREKCSGKEKIFPSFGKFASVTDEDFLGLGDHTREAVVAAYDRVFRAFGMEIGRYARIYMSFDEWNSFGVYLAVRDIRVPTTILTKYAAALERDIYHYLNAPEMADFRALQAQYRALNADQAAVTDVMTLWERPRAASCGGKPLSFFDFPRALDALSPALFADLLRFFAVQPESLPAGAFSLLLTDANWFAGKNTDALNYFRAYAAFADRALAAGEPLVVSQHPRFDMDPEPRGKIFPLDSFLPGHVPAELLCWRDRFPIRKTLSIGNPVPPCLTRKGEQVTASASWFFFYRLIPRLRAALRLTSELEYPAVYHDHIQYGDLENYARFFRAEIPAGFRFLPLEDYRGETPAFLILMDDGGEHLERKLISFLRRFPENAAALLNPERRSFSPGKQLPPVTLFKLKKYKIHKTAAYDPFEEPIYVFCSDSERRERIRRFSASFPPNRSGALIRVVTSDRRPSPNASARPESKQNVLFRAENSPVVIYGAGNIAADFLTRYGKALNVRRVMADPDEAVSPRLSGFYEVVPFDRGEIRPDDYMIICKPFVHNLDVIPPYALARDHLIRLGFRPLRDFAWYQIYDAAKSGKEIMLFVGYCEMSGIKQALELTGATRDYLMMFYHIGRETMADAPGYPDFVASAKLCDILVHAPLLVKRGVMDADVPRMVSPRTRKIFIPQMSFRGYAPYKAVRFTRRNFPTRLFGIMHYPFLYEIPFLNRALLDGMTNREILKMAKSPDLFSKQEIIDNMNMALRMMRIIDARSDVPIYDYIRDHYRDTLLFKDCVHVNDALFFEFARRLSAFLGRNYQKELNRAERLCRENGAYFQVATEEPIFPCVARALKLNFASPDRLYMLKVTEEHIRMETLDEWIVDYCDYFRAAVKLRHSFDPHYKTRTVRVFRSEGEEYDIKKLRGVHK